MKKRIIKTTIILFLFQTFLIIVLLFFIKPIPKSIYKNKSPNIIINDNNNQPIIELINNHPIIPIDINKINPNYINYLLFLEDKTFYKHSGFNLQRIGKTIITNMLNSQKHGASTITQQYIKNAYLNNEKTLSRKLKELYLAIKLEQTLSKNEILENYLNCIYFGNDIYGLGTASKYYFNKDYTNLSTKEILSLYALLKTPSYYTNNINKWNEYKNKICTKLYERKLINYETYIEVLTKINFNINNNIFPSNLRFYVDGVIKEFNSIKPNLTFGNKIIINTHFSNKINDFTIPNTSGNYASIAVDKDGFILSFIGGKNYYDSDYNIITKGKRDIGSTIKPLLYYEALKCGYTSKKTHFSAPFSFKYRGETVSFNNFSNNYYNKKIDMAIALATSDNIYAIKTHLDIGMKTLANHFKKYNIKAEPIPSLALGSIGMSLLDLVQIYSQFFTSGYYLNFQFIDNIIINNKIIFKQTPNKKALGNAEKFKQIRDIMDGVFNPKITYSTAHTIGSLLNSKCYGKSGLTDFDSYMIGFNEEILIGAWSGYLDNSPLTDINIKRLPKYIFLKQINSY